MSRKNWKQKKIKMIIDLFVLLFYITQTFAETVFWRFCIKAWGKA